MNVRSHSLRHEPAGEGDWRELARREGDGLDITLLWSRSADRVKVTVLDQRFDTPFEIDIDGADALSAFEHPFAFAQSRFVAADDVRPTQPLRQQA